MQFAIAIQNDPESVHGVTVEAIRNTREAILFHISAIVEDREEVTVNSSKIEDLIANPDCEGAIWAFVEVDLSKLDSRPERIDLSLPRFVPRRIDSYVETRHETRSGFLARVALEAIANC